MRKGDKVKIQNMDGDYKAKIVGYDNKLNQFIINIDGYIALRPEECLRLDEESEDSINEDSTSDKQLPAKRAKSDRMQKYIEKMGMRLSQEQQRQTIMKQNAQVISKWDSL
jgi:uncharacterized HAD superfamily protein